MTPNQKRISQILGILFLAACLVLGGLGLYQNRFPPVGENHYEKTTESIDLSGRTVADLSQLQAFPRLKRIDLRGTGLTCEEYDRVRAWFPEAEILWDIPFQGQSFPMDTRELTITTLSESDLAVLEYFTELETIQAQECPDYLVLDTLRRQRPELDMRYRIPVAGDTYSHEIVRMRLPGEDVEELFDLIPLFPKLWSVELEEPLAPVDRILALQEAFPEIMFSWHLELGGIPVDQFTKTLDLTGIPMTVEEMDAVLPYLLNLTYVDMTDCGIPNEEMDALNQRYENTKIVWTVDIGWMRCKTDITTFMPAREGMTTVHNSYVYNLRYCHDVVALDIGHMNVSDISFVAYMPHLKYLIVADTPVRDISPLEGLTELVYLEMFLTEVTECDALLTLTALEDLNLSYTQGDVHVVSQMTWLKNLWWANPTSLAVNTLPEALPDTHIVFYNKSSTGNGWRELPNYYAQRDAFGMYYMRG